MEGIKQTSNFNLIKIKKTAIDGLIGPATHIMSYVMFIYIHLFEAK